MNEAFKTCTNCRRDWQTREELLADRDVTVLGYQAHFDALELGLFLFLDGRCKRPFTIPAGKFTDLYEGPVFEGRRTGQDDCPGYCLAERELRPCPARCECAYVREALQIIADWPKAD